jgi:thiamine pyridinylase
MLSVATTKNVIGVRGWICSALAIMFILVGSSGAWAQGLTVALYPYVPRPSQFESAIRAAWMKVQPNVQLNFINNLSVWDGGYNTDPPPQADIYVFDAMYFEDFRTRGLLLAMSPSEIQNADDFLEYARNSVIVNGNYYAIPQLGCANMLFYNAADTAIANATTLGQLNTTLNRCTYTSEIPPDRRGLMVDMAGRTTNATLYLDIAHSVNGADPLPQPTTPDPTIVAGQRLILTLASFWNGTSNNATPYVRGVWFDGGYGRAFVGFTESMSVMSPQTLSTIGFKVMPLSNTVGKQPLFYVDAVGVNTSTTSRGIRDLAVQLANIIAATETIVESFKSPAPDVNPQYLMSVRNSVFRQLSQQYPIYQRMYQLARTSNPVAFKLNSAGRSWVLTAGGLIRQDVTTNYACGCDQAAPQPINSNIEAQSICPAVCSGRNGGWSGQWTNQPPAQGSVCGCNACPVN